MGEASAISHLVSTAWSARTESADPDDPEVRGFAEFGLRQASALATEEQLSRLDRWRTSLAIPPNSAFVDGTLLQTVWLLLHPYGPGKILTPVTLWELTTFVDALVCFDRLYCIANPEIDIAGINLRLGGEVLVPLPDPDGGMLRQLATEASLDGLDDMRGLKRKVGCDDAFGQEAATVAKGWQAVLGADLPDNSPFDTHALHSMRVLSHYLDRRQAAGGLSPTADEASADLIDGQTYAAPSGGLGQTLKDLTRATYVPPTVADADALERPPLAARRTLAATATYRTYVNQAVANALAVPYLPGTLRMPFRHLFIQRASQVHDELATVALANKILAQQQPSSPLTLPFFTTAVLAQATTRAGIWSEMAHAREQTAPFRLRRAELDDLLRRSEASPEALKLQAAIRDEALKAADVAGAVQQVVSVFLGVIAQTGIGALAGALKVGVDAAQGVGRDGAWTRIWRRLFRRHEHALAQTNSQAIALTNAMPQIERLWELPKIGGYLDRFAMKTREIGHILKDRDAWPES